MQEKVKKYVNKCDLCYKIKLSRHKPYEEMRQILISNYWICDVACEELLQICIQIRQLFQATNELQNWLDLDHYVNQWRI